MKTKRMKFLFGIAFIGSAPLDAQSNCQPVLEAMSRVLTTPTHIYRTMSPASKDASKPAPRDIVSSETIYAGGAVYSKGAGSWRPGKVSLEQVKKIEQENIKSSNFSCRYVRDEPVNGETTAVYSLHSEREGVTSDGQIWISKSKGLPLRHEFDMDPAKKHHSVRYEYTDVHPPTP